MTPGAGASDSAMCPEPTTRTNACKAGFYVPLPEGREPLDPPHDVKDLTLMHANRSTFWFSRPRGRDVFHSLPHVCHLAMSFALFLFIVPRSVAREAQANQASIRRSAEPPARMDSQRITLPMLDGKDIRFTRLSTVRGLSQTRVSQIVQDNQGFMWFGTQNGLNRYDGYKFKVFKHDPEDPDSLSGVYIYSLFKDRSGTIWVGTDQLLDRFDPLTEKFRHYRFDAQDWKGLATTVNHISQDSSGMLWLSTGKGLFRLDPATGRTAHFRHDANDPSSLEDNDIKSTGEDRAGTFWVATSHSLDEFDRNTGKVRKQIPLGDSGMGAWFHEDRFGVFWLIYGTDGLVATVDRKAGKLIPYSFNLKSQAGISKTPTYALLEDSEGTMWFGTGGAGLLKFDREHRRFVSYNKHPGDTDSLADTRVTTLFEDREGNIWVGLHEMEPNFFPRKPQVFEKFTHQPGNPNSLGSSLVSVLYEDHQGILWVGADRLLKRIDRKTGKYSTFEPVSGGEVLSIIEGGPDTLWFGTARQGVMRYDRRTGQITAYRHNPADPSSVCSELVERLLVDHNGTLWAASWAGLCRFDSSSGHFSTYRQDPSARGLNYYAIAEDHHGDLWLGSNLGLQRFEPETGKFTAYSHNLDNPNSLSDNRVNSVFFDHTGAMWVGTQNGLDKFERQTGTFTLYGERNGMTGNVVSCILEDRRGRLWMSTNQGVSSFDPITKRFNNYTAADGLPGADLTGWGACFKSAAGEMFFGGFSGATAFYPDKVVDSMYVPPVVLTDFRLSGAPVDVGAGSPLKKSITHADAVTLSHRQNMFSLEFSALSYSNPATNRYRYKLEGLDSEWHQVGSDQRLVSYTTLPAGIYEFRVQGATIRGPWNEPGVTLRIEILPPWWSTWWFRTSCAASLLLLIWSAYRYRMNQMARFYATLQRSEDRLRRVIDTIPAHVWSARPDGSVDFINHRWLESTGLAIKSGIGWAWGSVLHPDDLARFVGEWHAALTSGEPMESEARLRRPDGGYRWWLIRNVPLRDELGNIVKWYGTAVDIEDRKRAEEQLRESQVDLARANRVTSMGELTASLAHEVNQPIAATVTDARTCLRWLAREQPDVEEAREAASRIVKDANRAAEIIKRVRLLFEKGTPGQEPVDANEVIREMIVLLRGETTRYSILVRTELSADLPKAMGDRVQLQQVLMNLILNGIDAMKDVDGTRELTIESQRAENGQLLISVSDTGVGLPPQHADQIFNAFFTTKPHGTGLGLRISRSVVESHGGRLWAGDNSPRGARFYFTLPTQVELHDDPMSRSHSARHQ
jgi:PAS domain S-box-containing protein